MSAFDLPCSFQLNCFALLFITKKYLRFCIVMIETYSKSDFRHSCNLKFYCHGVMFTGGQTFHLFDNNNVWFINNLSLLSSKCMLIDLLLIWWWLCHETQMPKKVELHNCSNYLLQKISSNNSIFSDIFMIFKRVIKLTSIVIQFDLNVKVYFYFTRFHYNIYYVFNIPK